MQCVSVWLRIPKADLMNEEEVADREIITRIEKTAFL